MRNVLVTLSIVISLLSISVTNAQSFNQRARRIDSLITFAADRYEFNGVILIAEEGHLIYEKAIGFSNFETKERLTPNSMFALASVSKAFTAMGIMILKEDGKVDYESDIQTYFPDLPYQGVTIRHLLNHTSGLPDYERLLNNKWDREQIADNDDVWQMFKTHQPEVLFDPGHKYEYCNTGYVMLASIIEMVSGMPFREYLKESIFDKLHMDRTRIVNRRYRPEVIDDYAYSHVFSIADGGYTFPDNVDEFKYVYYLDGIVGDGCVNSTVEDLFRWDQALDTEQLVSSTTLEEAFTPPVLSEGSEADYGFGWHIRNTPDGKIIDHGGGYAGYINKFVRMVDKEQTIIMLTNNSFKYRNIIDCIIDILNDKECSLPPVYVDVELRGELIKNNMSVLNGKIETMLRDTVNYQFNERSINNMGYELLSADRIEDAIEVFRINVRMCPESGNVYDSLGEAYMENSQYKLAIENYEKSLQLDSENRNAGEMLKRLRGKQSIR